MPPRPARAREIPWEPANRTWSAVISPGIRGSSSSDSSLAARWNGNPPAPVVFRNEMLLFEKRLVEVLLTAVTAKDASAGAGHPTRRAAASRALAASGQTALAGTLLELVFPGQLVEGRLAHFPHRVLVDLHPDRAR